VIEKSGEWQNGILTSGSAFGRSPQGTFHAPRAAQAHLRRTCPTDRYCVLVGRGLCRGIMGTLPE
jgi:hypothetical protein